jgi:penicillin G amidase
MKIVYLFISLLVTLIVIVLLNSGFGKAPPFGKFLSPQHGFWQNAEPYNEISSIQVATPRISGSTKIYLDERLVPHVFAENENDAYFAQGYLHAKYRLWQMEFQTFVAAGRLTEVLGPGPDSAFLNNDRNMRRMGMVYGAKRSLEEMQRYPPTREHLKAYTDGVNSYIENLTEAELPLEYKLLNYYPERWTPLKTALLLKYLSFDLTGSGSDVEHTNAKAYFPKTAFESMYPLVHDSSSPVIPAGTIFVPPSVKSTTPASADSLYFQWKEPLNVLTIKADKDNGSNNWAADGTKTRSGRPILCNDPHLGLNLPSLWYEIQITTPAYSVYGVSLPGAPAVIIGFNDSIAWGVTNAARDVLDYYKIEFNSSKDAQYWYNKQWRNVDQVVERYKMKDGSEFIDTVAYTVFGPVMYDRHFNGKGRVSANVNLAVRWMAHEPSNELRAVTNLNKAKNYNEYVNAIKFFSCPGQNFAFASKSGDIAVWQQGKFPNKWVGQGDFIMPGSDTAYNWQGYIPQSENPHILNPGRNFISSANQLPADTAYQYYLGGSYDVYRGLMINRRLSAMSNITVSDMMKLQNENFNAFAETALPFLLFHVKENELTSCETKYLSILKKWNFRNDNEETGPTVFTIWFEALEQLIWDDELEKQPGASEKPESATLIEALRKDSAFLFIDDINTPQKETLGDIVTKAFKRATITAMSTQKEGRLAWNKYKDAGIRHLLRIEPLSRYHLNTGGGRQIINATQQFKGPSWKMIVNLTDEVEAYGIYPGGQDGNPGSRNYDRFVDSWAEGKYFRLWVMKKNDTSNRHIRQRIILVRKKDS